MSTWPGAVKNFLQLQDGVDYVIAQHPNDRGDEITSLMTYLGSPGNVQSKLAALNRLFKYQGAPLPKVTWIDADTIEIEACAVAMHDGTDHVFKENTSALQITLSADLDTGSEAADTWYDVYLIGDGSGSTYTAKFVVQGNTPSGATYYKKIFAVRNDGSSDILNFFHSKNKVTYDDVAENASLRVLNAGAQTGFTAVDCSAVVPSGAAMIDFNVIPSGILDAYFRATGSSATNGYKKTSAASYYFTLTDIPCSSGRSIDYKVGGNNITMYVKGYTMNLR